MNAESTSSNRAPLSFDALVFVALCGIYVVTYRLDPKGIILAALVVVYLLVDVLCPWEALTRAEPAFRRVFLGKQALLLFAIALVTFLPTALWVRERRSTGSLAQVKDSVAQIEAGLEFMRTGASPYGQDYSNTPMGAMPFLVNGLTENPALHHVIYLPFFFEFSYPFYLTSLKLWGWWDQRLLYMALLAVCLGLLVQIPSHPASKLAFLPLLGLNPMMIEFPWGGNDIFPLIWIVSSAVLLYRGRRTLAAMSLALAVASKQTAWFLVPCFLAFLLGPWPWRRGALVRAAREVWPAGVVLALTLAPFLLTNPRGFLADTLGFILGLSSFPAFVAGVGFGQLLFDLRLVSAAGKYPFWLWQAGLGLPLLLVLMTQQIRHNHKRLIWVHGACLGLVVNFFGRVFFDSYMGFYLVVALLGTLADPAGDVESH